MEIKNVKIEDLEIGILRYTFDARIYYLQTHEKEGEYTPASCSTEIEGHEIDGEIHCWNTETEQESIVTDPIEIRMIEDWVDWELELQKSF